jgi:DNA-directed RNA polymerase specialized sigma24 family protein
VSDDARDLAFSEYFVARSSQLRRTAFVILHDWHGAEDVTQRAFLNLYGAWPRVSDAGRDAYARRIVVNEALSELRRRGRRPELSSEVPPDDRATAGALPDHPLDLVKALELLAP